MKKINKLKVRYADAMERYDNAQFEIHRHRPNYDHVTDEMVEELTTARREVMKAKNALLLYKIEHRDKC